MNSTRATRQAASADDQKTADRLAETFARYQDELLGMLYYVVGNADDAQDALQEAFVKCWRRRKRLAEIEDLKAWVFRVALNAGRDLRGTAWRRHRRSLTVDEATLPAAAPGPEADAARREQLELIRRALLTLRSEEREVFLLRQNGQMTYEQIAESLELPVGTVKTRMRLALSKLRESLDTRP